MTAAPVHFKRNPAHSRREMLMVRAAMQRERTAGFTPSPRKPRLSTRGEPGQPWLTKAATPWRKAAAFEARTGMGQWHPPERGELMGDMLLIGMGRA